MVDHACCREGRSEQSKVICLEDVVGGRAGIASPATDSVYAICTTARREMTWTSPLPGHDPSLEAGAELAPEEVIEEALRHPLPPPDPCAGTGSEVVSTLSPPRTKQTCSTQNGGGGRAHCPRKAERNLNKV